MSPDLWAALEPICWWLVATGTAALIVLAGPREDWTPTHTTERTEPSSPLPVRH